jgi:hypothetical protein
MEGLGGKGVCLSSYFTQGVDTALQPCSLKCLDYDFIGGCDHQQWITITDGSAVPRQTAQVEAKEGSSAEIHRGEKVLAMAGEPRDLGMVGTCCGNEMEGT